MNRFFSLLVVVCLIILFCFSSCKKSDILVESMSTSSDVTYIETTSEISKTEENGDFTFEFDPYVLTSDVKKALGSTEQYRKFVDAVLAGNNLVAISSRDEYDMIRFAIGENFPFAALISNYRYDSANNKILISYKYNNTHNEKISSFKSLIKDIFDLCVKNTDDNAIAAISLYSWITKNIDVVDNMTSHNITDEVSLDISVSEVVSSKTSEDDEVSADIFNTLVEKKGTSSSVASLYNFLLMQLGIECRTVSAWDVQGYKTWNMVLIDSKWYHCDISSEQKSTQGEGLKFFGMTQQQVAQNINNNDIFSGQ